MNTYPVSSKTELSKLAGAISKSTNTGHTVKLQAVGPGAVNQAVKAIAVARHMVGERGADLFFTPSFQNITIDGEARTMIEIKIEEQMERKEEEFQTSTNTMLQ